MPGMQHQLRWMLPSAVPGNAYPSLLGNAHPSLLGNAHPSFAGQIFPFSRGLSRPCPTPVTRPVERPVSPEVFLLYWSNPDLVHHSQSWTCIMHLTSAKSILDPWHIPLLVLMTLFLYLLHQPCFCPCLRSLPLVYFIDLVPFLFPPCSISKCLLVTIYTPTCLILYKYSSTSPCISSLKSTKFLLPIPSLCSLCLTRTYARGQCLTSVVVPNWSPVLPELFPA